MGCTPNEDDGYYHAPSDSTFQRVLNKIDAAAVASMNGRWLRQQEIGALAQLAVHGKVLRGSGRYDGEPLQPALGRDDHLRLTLDTMLALIRGHWTTIENGSHYRRDVTLGEDANRTATHNGAFVLVSLRNLTNRIHELQKERQKTTADSLNSWCASNNPSPRFGHFCGATSNCQSRQECCRDPAVP